MKSTPALAALAIVCIGAGFGGGWLAADDGATVASLKQESARLTARATRAGEERDRLRQERDQLEEQLTAQHAPAVCPREFVSTASLLPGFALDYPCGWHVMYNPDPGTAAEERPGLLVQITLFSRLPISLAPRETSVADVELGDWTDDANDPGDKLPTGEKWAQDERARFTSVAHDERFEVADGITVFRISGAIATDTETLNAAVEVWEFHDGLSGARHIARVFSLQPNARASAALDRMARSFKIQRS